MIREAYFEGSFYVPLVQRAYEAWRRLEEESGRPLLRQTGGLMLGPPDGDLVRGSRASARRHSLAYEELSAREVARRFPVFRLPADQVAILEPRAGYLDPEGCIRAFLEAARAAGAELHAGEALTGWSADRNAVSLRTEAGRYRARRLLIAAGAWTPSLLPDLPLPLSVERVVQYWFRPTGDPEPFRPERCPVFAWGYEPDRIWYGFPLRPRGIKVGLHHGIPAADVEDVERCVEEGETEEMRGLVARLLPGGAGPLREASVCLYTKTPDGHFLVDRHPRHSRVVVASPCSGHGFKFASVLGDALADLLGDRTPDVDLTPFRLDRFQQA